VLGGANRSFPGQFNSSITDVALKGKSLEVVALKEVHEKTRVVRGLRRIFVAYKEFTHDLDTYCSRLGLHACVISTCACKYSILSCATFGRCKEIKYGKGQGRTSP
jgi:hypothetical protein